MDNLTQISEALKGTYGVDQKRIAETGISWLNLLLEKNRDYGSSAWLAPVLCPELPEGSAILVRMSDKVRRIAQLSKSASYVVDESFEDTVRDLGGYCLLYLARPK